MVKLLPILLILFAISLTSFLLTGKHPINFKSKASTPPFQIGFNVTGLPHYGYGDAFPYADASQVDTTLKELQRMGVTIVRVEAAQTNINADEAARRLDLFLTKAQSYNISAIVFFGGLIKDDHGLYPKSIEPYFTDSWNGMLLLNHDFFAGGYKTSYLPYMQTVISYNKNHANIYAWEIGNEFKDSSDPAAFVNFAASLSSAIKSWDPSHPVATGMINAAHTGLTPATLYPQLPNIDIITVHTYNGDKAGAADVDWAVSQSKKAIIEEAGFGGTGDRSGSIKQEMDYWKSKGSSAFMQWGFIAKGLGDNGNGDKNYGMDNIWHTDYDLLATLYQTYASSQTTPTPSNGASPCDPSQLQMSVNPNPANTGSTVTFNLSGTQGSTYVGDNWSGGVDCNGNFWGSKTCNALSAGTFEWTHTWKNCAANDCSITSSQCSKVAAYSVSGTPPTTTPTPYVKTFYITPNPANPNNQVKAYLEGSSLCTSNAALTSPGFTAPCGNPVATCNGSNCSGTMDCTTVGTGGNYTATFTGGGLAACTKNANFTIISSMTVSNINMFSSSQKGKRYVYTTVTVINEADHKPLPGASVSATTKLPSGSSSYYTASTNVNGQVTFSTQSKERGTHTSTVTGVVKSGFVYHPTYTSQSLSI